MALENIIEPYWMIFIFLVKLNQRLFWKVSKDQLTFKFSYSGTTFYALFPNLIPSSR